MTDSLIRLTTDNDLERAARLLEHAFVDDPLMLYVLPDPDQRARRVGWYYDANVKHAALFGEVWATLDFEGVAAWLTPSASSHWSFDKLNQSGLWQMDEKLGAEAAERFMRTLNSDAPYDDDLYWYLLLIGVEPEKQRQGIGHRLLEPILNRTDSDEVPIRLETNDESNLPFYLKQGFELIGKGRTPGGPGMWSLRRPPSH